MWWERERLYLEGKTFFIGGVELKELLKAEEVGDQPVYIYDTERIKERVGRLKEALEALGEGARGFYAMKANRNPALLECIRETGLGVDVCSPGELALALEAGFLVENISFTGTSLSRMDWKRLQGVERSGDLRMNCDGLSAVKKWMEWERFREGSAGLGVRMDPGVGVGYRENPMLEYAGKERGKFGVGPEQVEELKALCEKHGVKLKRVHWHAGCGFLKQWGRVEKIIEEGMKFVKQFDTVEEINLGGGLGVPLQEDDGEFEIERWVEVVKKQVAGRYQVQVEPGAFLVQDSGVLVAEITYVEKRGGKWFVGVNAGFPLLIEPVFYGMPCQPVLIKQGKGTAGVQKGERVKVVGNINEGLDQFGEWDGFEGVEEGDWVAFLNAGAYAAAMASNHCLRGKYQETVI